MLVKGISGEDQSTTARIAQSSPQLTGRSTDGETAVRFGFSVSSTIRQLKGKHGEAVVRQSGGASVGENCCA